MTFTLETLTHGFTYVFNSNGKSWQAHRDGEEVVYVGVSRNDEAQVRFNDGKEWGTDASFLHPAPNEDYPPHTIKKEEPIRLKTPEEIEDERFIEIDHRAVAWMGKIVDVLNDNIGPLDAGYGNWTVKEVIVQFDGDTDTGFRIAGSEFSDGLAVLVRGR